MVLDIVPFVGGKVLNHHLLSTLATAGIILKKCRSLVHCHSVQVSQIRCPFTHSCRGTFSFILNLELRRVGLSLVLANSCFLRASTLCTSMFHSQHRHHLRSRRKQLRPQRRFVKSRSRTAPMLLRGKKSQEQSLLILCGLFCSLGLVREEQAL